MTDQKQEPKLHMEIQRIYSQDLSLEVPGAPEIFRGEWKPEISVDLHLGNKKLEEKSYEVSLSVTVTAKSADKVIFLVEAKQVGIFSLSGFSDEQMEHLLNVYCPTVIFPYVREVVADLVNRASLPQFNLAPVDFETLYRQKKH